MSIDVHTLSGAYALDSLTPEEAAEFEAHLEGCAACREEVGEFREVVAAMGAQSWASAPRSLGSTANAVAQPRLRSFAACSTSETRSRSRRRRASSSPVPTTRQPAARPSGMARPTNGAGSSSQTMIRSASPVGCRSTAVRR